MVLEVKDWRRIAYQIFSLHLINTKPSGIISQSDSRDSKMSNTSPNIVRLDPSLEAPECQGVNVNIDAHLPQEQDHRCLASP